MNGTNPFFYGLTLIATICGKTLRFNISFLLEVKNIILFYKGWFYFTDYNEGEVLLNEAIKVSNYIRAESSNFLREEFSNFNSFSTFIEKHF